MSLEKSQLSGLNKKRNRRFQNGKHAAVQYQPGISPEKRELYREGTQLRRLPYPATGSQTTEVGIRQNS
jgi:hypothetical protein